MDFTAERLDCIGHAEDVQKSGELMQRKKSIPSDGKFEGGKKGHLTGKWEGLSEKGGDYFLGAINFIKIKLDGM